MVPVDIGDRLERECRPGQYGAVMEAQFPPQIVTDRNAFLDEVKRYVDAKRRKDFAEVLDDLIKWSEGQGQALVFAPRAEREQFFVTYSLNRVPTHTFWQAYPHEEDGARFYVTGDVVLATADYRALYDAFAALSTGRKPKTPDRPTMSFGDLIWKPYRQEVKKLLSRALTSLGLPVNSMG
jgi:hypothetical protein